MKLKSTETGVWFAPELWVYITTRLLTVKFAAVCLVMGVAQAVNNPGTSEPTALAMSVGLLVAALAGLRMLDDWASIEVDSKRHPNRVLCTSTKSRWALWLGGLLSIVPLSRLASEDISVVLYSGYLATLVLTYWLTKRSPLTSRFRTAMVCAKYPALHLALMPNDAALQGCGGLVLATGLAGFIFITDLLEEARWREKGR